LEGLILNVLTILFTSFYDFFFHFDFVFLVSNSIIFIMRGRKPSVPHQVIIDAVVLFKDRVIVTDRDGVKRKYLPILITY